MEYTIYCCFPHTRGKFTEVHLIRGAHLKFPPYAGEVYYLCRRIQMVNVVSPIRGGSLLI